MISPISLLTNPKVIGVIVLLAAIAGGFIYVNNLNKKVDKLEQTNAELSIVNKSNQEAIAEDQRRDEVVDEVTKTADKERVTIKEIYQTRIREINESVQEGKDRPVGPLLSDYFNNRL